MSQPVGLFSSTLSLLQRALHLRTEQHQALSSNVANADTPHYKPFEVLVEEELRKFHQPTVQQVEVTRTQENHLLVGGLLGTRSVELHPVKAPAFSLRADGNTVDLDHTMGAMAENSLKYNASAQLLSGKLKGLLKVIRG
jgi:flagellar basal-body rod protein FlgB